VIASKAFWGANPFFTAAMIEQKRDATMGLILLITGFMLQAGASAGMNVNAQDALLILGPFGLMLLIYDGRKESIVVTRTLRALEPSSQKNDETADLRKRLVYYLRSSQRE
jgi:hypothetical protein